MDKLSSVFAALSDVTRVRILALIAEEGEICTCELVEALGEVQPKISRHMAVLRDAGILSVRKDARWCHHAIAEGLEKWARNAVDAAVAGISPQPVHQTDRSRLDAMTNRPPREKAA